MSQRNKLTTAPVLVNDVINTTNNKRNGSIVTLQDKMETTSHWLDEAITSAKRKIVEGTGVSIQDVKKAKTIAFKKEVGAPLSPIPDKENSPNSQAEAPRIRVKPPPSAVKRKVVGMKVAELRKELRSKGHNQKGLKKDLQQRLLQAYSTVETIMSPPRAQTKHKASDEFPDSESVEVVVFESSSDGQENPEENERGRVKATENSIFGKQACANLNSNVSERGVVSDSASGTTAALGHVAEEPEGMDIEPTNEPHNQKRASIVDQTINRSSPEEKMASRVPSLPKATLPHESSRKEVASKVTLSLEPPNPQEKQLEINKPSLGAHSIRKLSQESLQTPGSVRSNDSDTSAKSTSEDSQPEEAARDNTESARKLSQEPLQTSNSVKSSESDTSARSTSEDSQPDALQDKTESAVQTGKSNSIVETVQRPEANRKKNEDCQVKKTSPMKRGVQAAIHLFNTVSNVPVAWPKPTNTPGKLHQVKYNNNQQDTQASESKRPELQQDARKPWTQTAVKPTGLASTIKATSAIKASRFAAGTNESAEARQARIDKMREKSKPVEMTSSTKKDVTKALSPRKTNQNILVEEKGDKRKALRDQMREKAAAAARDKAGVTAISEFSKEAALNDTKPRTALGQQYVGVNRIVTGTQSDRLSSAKAPNASENPNKHIVASAASKEASANNAQMVNDPVERKTSANAAEQIRNTYTASKQQHTKKTAEPRTPSSTSTERDVLAMLRPQLLSPMDTYEISDREDSESESEGEDEDESQEARKKIPDWAQKTNLLPALEKQFSTGEFRVDPDEIFPEVRTCDLQAIFNNKRSRYLKRTSSGNWSRDRVTAAEKLTYKRTMGFIQKTKK